MVKAEPFRQRHAGVLLHVTSLPGGDLGADAYRFVDFLTEAGISVWQVLPLGPTHEDLSPYQCLSAHAGNPKMISLQSVAEEPWFSGAINNIDLLDDRKVALQEAYHRFITAADQAAQDEFSAFCRDEAFWLEDYVLFQSLREAHNNAPWFEWPKELHRQGTQAVRQVPKVRLDYARFEQFIFFRQWSKLKSYANWRGVLMFGDMPIFVAHDSADVWARPEYFSLDEDGRLTAVAGVPPDYFSATGQRWGNPLYRWDRLETDSFSWWLKRMRTQLRLYDMIRIDHFRGFEAHWEIPANCESAASGHWVKAPGRALFEALESHYGVLPLVAEDLGTITPEVETLRDQFHLPGMKVLQFAFEGADNPYLPWNYVENCVAYTGTHDNDTTLSWFNSLSEEKQHYVYECLGFPAEPMPWALIQCAFKSIAEHAMVPMQDILELGSEGRMNLPGTTEGNWRWQFNWPQLKPGLAVRLRALIRDYDRLIQA